MTGLSDRRRPRSIEEVLADNAHLIAITDTVPRSGGVGSRATAFMWAVVVLSIVAVVAMVTLAILRPNDTSTGTLIVGLLLPVITAFLGAALQQVHLAVNSRLTELLALTAASSKAEGRLEGSGPIPVPPIHNREDA